MRNNKPIFSQLRFVDCVLHPALYHVVCLLSDDTPAKETGSPRHSSLSESLSETAQRLDQAAAVSAAVSASVGQWRVVFVQLQRRRLATPGQRQGTDPA